MLRARDPILAFLFAGASPCDPLAGVLFLGAGVLFFAAGLEGVGAFLYNSQQYHANGLAYISYASSCTSRAGNKPCCLLLGGLFLITVHFHLNVFFLLSLLRQEIVVVVVVV